MSFGWSAGDIVAVLNHLKVIQATPLDAKIATSLQQLCEQIRVPLDSFRSDIQSSFDRDLGANSTRLKLLTTHRKIQWALSTSKKVKRLREQIALPISGISIVLGQQVV